MLYRHNMLLILIASVVLISCHGRLWLQSLWEISSFWSQMVCLLHLLFSWQKISDWRLTTKSYFTSWKNNCDWSYLTFRLSQPKIKSNMCNKTISKYYMFCSDVYFKNVLFILNESNTFLKVRCCQPLTESCYFRKSIAV